MRFAELHLHLYGTIRPTDFLDWVRDRDVDWSYYERVYEEAYGCCFQYPHFNLGRVLLMKDRVAEAERAFERALSYDADYLPARKALEFIREREGEAL